MNDEEKNVLCDELAFYLKSILLINQFKTREQLLYLIEQRVDKKLYKIRQSKKLTEQINSFKEKIKIYEDEIIKSQIKLDKLS